MSNYEELARDLLQWQVEDDPETCACDAHVKNTATRIGEFLAPRLAEAARQIVDEWVREYLEDVAVVSIEFTLRSVIGGST